MSKQATMIALKGDEYNRMEKRETLHLMSVLGVAIFTFLI